MIMNRTLTLTMLAASLLAPAAFSPAAFAQDAQDSQGAAQAQQSYPLDKLVTLTCRQAWQMSGKTQDGFFAIVKQLAELSAQNRGVTLPDDKAAGARAGDWIRTHAIADPDQLLYEVVDHAVQYSIKKGTAKPS